MIFQTNYFVSVALAFLIVFFFVPWKMLYIVIVLAIGNILAQSWNTHFWYFYISSVWSSVLHVPPPRPCQGLEEKSPHGCHVRHFRHWEFSDLPGWFYLIFLSLGNPIKYFQFGWFTMFFWGIFLPLLSVAAHAFLHVKGKTLIIKGPFWKKKKEIELEPNEANKDTNI